jgi:aryl-alcohol dehydrogenase-like predicted oxidoreductase
MGEATSSTGSLRSPRAEGLARAQIVLAWLLAQSAVTSPVVGVTKRAHLEDAMAAVDVELSSWSGRPWVRATCRTR